MNSGVLPQVLPDPGGFRVEYEIVAVGVVGIISVVLAAVSLVWTLFTAMGFYKKGVAAQLDQTG